MIIEELKYRSPRLVITLTIWYNVKYSLGGMMTSKKTNIVHIRSVVPMEQEPREVNRHPKKVHINKMKVAIVIVIISILYFAYMNVGIFVDATITKIHTEEINGNNRYIAFSDRILRYGKDGMGILNKSGTELWNAPYQISNPIVAITGNSLAIADRNGNKIMVMDQLGVKGEIEAALPIEKISVSSQGIVAALVKDDKSSQVICYDSVGNILAELVVSVATVGYPLDVGISYDGTLIFATYLHYNDGNIKSVYRCYNLETAEATSTEKIIIEETLYDVVTPSTFFINQNTAVVVSDSAIYLYDMEVAGYEPIEISLDKEIGQIFHNESYLGVVLIGSAVDIGNEIRVYNSKGVQISSITYTGEYSNVEFIDDKVILYDGIRCIIYKINGREVFQGTFDLEIVSILPKFGMNKYVVVGRDSIVDVRLKR